METSCTQQNSNTPNHSIGIFAIVTLSMTTTIFAILFQALKTPGGLIGGQQEYLLSSFDVRGKCLLVNVTLCVGQ